jgi:hypothetical protein
MLVKTRWPALIPAIKRAGHEPVLVYPTVEPSTETVPTREVDERLVLILDDMGGVKIPQVDP